MKFEIDFRGYHNRLFEMIKNILRQKKNLILDTWIQSILETYPSESSDFLKHQKNQFSNPVGYIISDTVEKIFDAILNDSHIVEIKLLVVDLIRIRAVQNFLPSQAVGFVFSLKKVIRDVLKQEFKNEDLSNELLEFETKIDMVALIVFDLYMEAREKVFQIRVNEMKNSVYQK
jgi:hypothetical protein